MVFNKKLIKNDFNNFSFKTSYEHPVPPCSVRVKLKTCSICGTDLDIAYTQRNDAARVLGHEGYGTVIEVGRQVKNYKVGDQVTFNPVNPFDQDDILGHSYDGLFSTFYDLDLNRHDYVLIKLPEGWTSPLATLLEPISVAVYTKEVLSKANLDHEFSGLIIGTGGFSRLLQIFWQCFDVSLESFSLTENTILPSGFKLSNKQRDSFDIIFLCVSRNQSLPAFNKAVKFLKPGGIIYAISGFNSLNEPFINEIMKIRRHNTCGNNMDIKTIIFHDHEIRITGHRGSNPQLFDKAISHLIQHEGFYNNLINRKIKFDDLADFFNKKDAYSRAERGKTIVIF